MGRMEKINNQMKREISKIVQQELSDPRLTFVTITQVDASPDLKNAKVSFSVLGDDEALQKATLGLNGARGLIRHALSQHMSIRHTPELHFLHDESIVFGAKLEKTIKEIHDEQKKDN